MENDREIPWHARRSLRLRNHDYTGAATYFVTVCSYQQIRLFGQVVDSTVRLNDFGIVVETCWRSIPDHFPNAELDNWVTMPNHLHGILMVTLGSSITAHASSSVTGRKRGSLGVIVGSFKSAVTKRINEMRGTPGAHVWQRNYHEHIVRDDADLNRIREYIKDNARCWADDGKNPTR
jgi:putative transposase